MMQPQSVNLDSMVNTFFLHSVSHRAVKWIAIFCIAFQAITVRAESLSSPKNEVDEQAQISQLRDQITLQRTQVQAAYLAEQQACYQRFSVNACLVEARDKRNTLVADLKRQDISLNYAERKRKAADKLRRTEEKTSPRVVEQQSLRRGAALLDAEQRQQRAQEKSANKPDPAVLQNSTPKTAETPPAVKKALGKQDKKPATADKGEQVAQARARYDQRQKEAVEKALEVQKKLQQRKKPAAQPLPIPGN